MKFTTIEANSLFAFAISVEKQILDAEKEFKHSKLNGQKLINYRKKLNGYFETIKVDLNNIAKQNLDNLYREI